MDHKLIFVLVAVAAVALYLHTNKNMSIRQMLEENKMVLGVVALALVLLWVVNRKEHMEGARVPRAPKKVAPVEERRAAPAEERRERPVEERRMDDRVAGCNDAYKRCLNGARGGDRAEPMDEDRSGPHPEEGSSEEYASARGVGADLLSSPPPMPKDGFFLNR